MASTTTQIECTEENARELFRRYHNDPAAFMEDILRMELDDWQREACEIIVEHDRLAVSSGHGVGKTALAAGIIQWFMALHPDPFIVVTANTKTQLSEKTWRELAKWHKKSLVKDWFEWSATQFKFRPDPETWFASAVPQSEHNAEAFAGAHERYVLQIFDEASILPDIIFETAEGATPTEGGYRKWLIFGNPTQNTGSFYDACFGERSHRWKSLVVDATKCKYSDKKQIADWAEDYGVDSDFYRIRVLGLPPKQAVTTLIGQEVVETASGRAMQESAYRFAPKILAVDTARYGDDETVICFRQGLKCHWFRAYYGLNEMTIAEKVAGAIHEVSPNAVFFDTTGGYGAGAHDRLRQLNYKKITPVNFASRDGIDEQYQNMRISMWDKMADWLRVGSMPVDTKLNRELTTPELQYNMATGKKQLESKKDIKERLGRSPDRADALAITFSYPVAIDEPERFMSQAERDWEKTVGLDSGSGAWHLGE